MDGNWVLAGVVAVFAIIAIVGVSGLFAISLSLDNIERTLNTTGDDVRQSTRTLGQIGNFLWPQHTLAKRQLQQQDKAEALLADFNAKLKAKQAEHERPATAEQVANLGGLVADLASSVDGLSEEIDDTSTIEEFRGTLAGLEAKLARVEDALATKDKAHDSLTGKGTTA